MRPALRRARATAAVAAAAAAVLPVAACGGRDSDAAIRLPVVRAVETLQRAFAADDMATVCRHLTWAAKDQAGRVAHHFPTTCERDVRRALRIVRDGGGWSDWRPKVVAVVGGDDGEATATLLGRGGWRADVPFVERDGRWRLAGFFGVAPERFEDRARAIRGRPFPAPGRVAVKATAGGGEPCRTPSDDGYPDITGGCSFVVASRSVPIRMLTPFGAFKFADCAISYRVSTDAVGRTWTTDWESLDTTQPGCSDVDACNSEGFGQSPWKGRLVGDGRGGYRHHMDICMRTCIGLFAGELVVRLVRDGAGWRAAGTVGGATGFRIDGALDVEGAGFNLDTT